MKIPSKESCHAINGTGTTTKGRPQGLPRKKKRLKEDRLVPLGIKMKSLITGHQNVQADKDLERAKHGEPGRRPRKKVGEV